MASASVSSDSAAILPPTGDLTAVLSSALPAQGVTYAYGTAGFRMASELLPSVALRCGVLAAARSKVRAALPTGVMITASHNPEQDNGVKIADVVSGGMLDAAWEPLATDLANAASAADAMAVYKRIVGEHEALPCFVVVGRDARPSSEALAASCVAAARAAGARVLDLGVVTTPQLHWIVLQANLLAQSDPIGFKALEKSPIGVSDYYDAVSGAFEKTMTLASSLPAAKKAAWKASLTVDCACGVGGPAALAFAAHPAVQRAGLQLVAVNGLGDGPVNDACGAEYVQKQKSFPQAAAGKAGAFDDAAKDFASLDGDADRLVFFNRSASGDGALQLLDGDKIMALWTTLLLKLLQDAELKLTLGVVQTAYANGASTKFLAGLLGREPDMAKTGVKHLHHRALDFDVSVYFEANGHGTLLFSPKALGAISRATSTTAVPTAVVDSDADDDEEDAIAAALGAPPTPANKRAAGEMSERSRARKLLQALTVLANQAIGDALSDLLVSYVALRAQGWTMAEWHAMYAELPSRMLKAAVPDRTQVQTTDAERRCVAPAGLQDRVDALVAEVDAANGRAFVRPSGTEDVVRIYAEASTQELADQLAEKIKAALPEFCH